MISFFRGGRVVRRVPAGLSMGGGRGQPPPAPISSRGTGEHDSPDSHALKINHITATRAHAVATCGRARCCRFSAVAWAAAARGCLAGAVYSSVPSPS